MAGSQSPASPLDELSAGEHASEAFKLLGNETRLAILVTLWERYRPFNEGTPVRFSELRERVGTIDSGQFNYHLDQLTGHFVDSSGDGYELSDAGLKFVRSVIAGAGIEEPTLDPTEVDIDCKLCGGAVEVTYENGWVYVLCTECDGLWADHDDRSRGTLAKFSLDPAGLTDRSPEEIYAAAWVTTFHKLYGMIDGVCPTCSGPIERSLEICDDHASEGLCSNCGRHVRIAAQLHCVVCKEWIRTTVGSIAKYHPAVVGFCYEHGLDLQYGFNDLEQIDRRLELARSDIEPSASDPPRVEVTTELDGDEIRVTLDENLSVVAIEE